MSQFSESDIISNTTLFFRRLKKNVTDSLTSRSGTNNNNNSEDNNNSNSNDSVDSNNINNNNNNNNENNNININNNNNIINTTENQISTTTTPTPIIYPIQNYRINKFEQILNSENIDLNELRKLSWNGIPHEFRGIIWELLLGYLPTNKNRRETTLIRKRKEYSDALINYYETVQHDKESEMMRQILVDLPRTCPDFPFFQQIPVQKMMERILCVWSTRHPASGYVQGLNDLLTPLLLVCLSPHVINSELIINKTNTITDVLRCDVSGVFNNDILMTVECDAYWCLTKLLDNIQDHYTDAQPGLQRMGMRLEDLMKRIDSELHQHFVNEGLLYVQFSFRWMNCLLLRELPLRAILRVWDTYLSEERSGFENFHVYVCAVLLKTFRETLLKMQFQEMIMLLQDIPTKDWQEEDIEPILSQAYILSTLFEDSPSHLQ